MTINLQRLREIVDSANKIAERFGSDDGSFSASAYIEANIKFEEAIDPQIIKYLLDRLQRAEAFVLAASRIEDKSFDTTLLVAEAKTILEQAK